MLHGACAQAPKYSGQAPTLCTVMLGVAEAWGQGVRTCVTCDGAQEAQGRGVPLVLVDHPLAGRHRDGDGQADRLVELSPPRLNGHDGRHGHSVAQELGGQLGRDGLGLETK